MIETYEACQRRLAREWECNLHVLYAAQHPEPARSWSRDHEFRATWVHGVREITLTMRGTTTSGNVTLVWSRGEMGKKWTTTEADAGAHFGWLEGG